MPFKKETCTRMPDLDKTKRYRPKTLAVRGGSMRSAHGETSEALFLTSGFAYDAPETAEARFKGEQEGYTYSRFGNPTVSMFEERMALIEGAEMAKGTASGLAAVHASLMCFLRTGDHVVAARALFGGCRFIIEDLLPRFGITVSFVDGRDLEAWEQAIRPQTKALFLETPSNPTLEIIDIAAVARVARGCGALLIVDNVFATPVLQKPLQLGADVVVYSATKHIDGQGRVMGGVILGRKQYLTEHLQSYLRNTGPTLAPFNAWVMLKSLETLDLRVREMCRHAMGVADALGQEAPVARVIYPGRADHPQHNLARAQMEMPGNIITFEVKGGRPAAFAVVKALKIIDISNNLGDAKSLITHPATTTHQRLTPEARAELGVTEGMLRLSVGLEDPQDLIEDLAQALKAA
ncbi:MAG TPA: O-succinylhomoserine sulfhydrylase [Alphaproteobacteria bacterium]|nr:O-succinylhomoserine sulfhydrylase [Alphaproteobacteria bacterium]